MTLRIIFAGTPEFAAVSLSKLLKSDHEIIAVYTQPDRPSGRGLKFTASPVKELAIAQHIPVFQPKSFKILEEQQLLKSLAADVMVVAAYGLILPKAVIEIPRLGCINVHASLLPRWRGAAPIQRAILAGDTQTGITIMQMDEGLDTGGMLSEKSCTINSVESAGELHDRLAVMGAELLLDTLNKIESSLIQAVPQDDSLATYAAKIQKNEAEINWNKSALQLVNEIRAFNPWPGSYTYFQKERLKIWKAEETVSDTKNYKPGTLLKMNNDSIDIVTGKGVLRVLQVQMPGGRVVGVNDFVNAHRVNLIAGINVFG